MLCRGESAGLTVGGEGRRSRRRRLQRDRNIVSQQFMVCHKNTIERNNERLNAVDFFWSVVGPVESHLAVQVGSERVRVVFRVE